MNTTPLRVISSAMAAIALSISPAVAAASPLAGPTAVTHGVERAIADVPWSEVGPGWTLATWSPAVPHRPGDVPAPGEATWKTSPVTLYLVDPAGNRYAIKTFPVGETPQLLDWSGDGGHALFGREYPAPDTVTLVDVHTGAESTIDVHGYPTFTKPDGKAILVSTDTGDDKPATLKRIDLDGNPQQSYPVENLGGPAQFTGSQIESPEGTRLVLGTDAALVAMDNDGTNIRPLAEPPVSNSECRPVRWWTADAILAHCEADRSSGSQLWTVPLDGSAPTALTAVNSGQGDDPGFRGDLGDGVAWQLPGGVFLQSAGACGTMFLSRLTADGHTMRVDVPGMHDSVQVAGVNGDKLELLGKVGCGGTDSLVSYDTVTNSSTVLLGRPINGGGVTEAIPFSGRQGQ
ncbi:MAG: hypothetical protein ACXVGO_15810 [Mycobacterium sp.]